MTTWLEKVIEQEIPTAKFSRSLAPLEFYIKSEVSETKIIRGVGSEKWEVFGYFFSIAPLKNSELDYQEINQLLFLVNLNQEGELNKFQKETKNILASNKWFRLNNLRSNEWSVVKHDNDNCLVFSKDKELGSIIFLEKRSLIEEPVWAKFQSVFAQTPLNNCWAILEDWATTGLTPEKALIAYQHHWLPINIVKVEENTKNVGKARFHGKIYELNEDKHKINQEEIISLTKDYLKELEQEQEIILSERQKEQIAAINANCDWLLFCINSLAAREDERPLHHHLPQIKFGPSTNRIIEISFVGDGKPELSDKEFPKQFFPNTIRGEVKIETYMKFLNEKLVSEGRESDVIRNWRKSPVMEETYSWTNSETGKNEITKFSFCQVIDEDRTLLAGENVYVNEIELYEERVSSTDYLIESDKLKKLFMALPKLEVEELEEEPSTIVFKGGSGESYDPKSWLRENMVWGFDSGSIGKEWIAVRKEALDNSSGVLFLVSSRYNSPERKTKRGIIENNIKIRGDIEDLIFCGEIAGKYLEEWKPEFEIYEIKKFGEIIEGRIWKITDKIKSLEKSKVLKTEFKFSEQKLKKKIKKARAKIELINIWEKEIKEILNIFPKMLKTSGYQEDTDEFKRLIKEIEDFINDNKPVGVGEEKITFPPIKIKKKNAEVSSLNLDNKNTTTTIQATSTTKDKDNIKEDDKNKPKPIKQVTPQPTLPQQSSSQPIPSVQPKSSQQEVNPKTVLITDNAKKKKVVKPIKIDLVNNNKDKNKENSVMATGKIIFQITYMSDWHGTEGDIPPFGKINFTCKQNSLKLEGFENSINTSEISSIVISFEFQDNPKKGEENFEETLRYINSIRFKYKNNSLFYDKSTFEISGVSAFAESGEKQGVSLSSDGKKINLNYNDFKKITIQKNTSLKEMFPISPSKALGGLGLIAVIIVTIYIIRNKVFKKKIWHGKH